MPPLRGWRRIRLALLLGPLLAIAAGATVYWQSRTDMVDRFLSPHMFFGALALAGAPAAMLTRKGGWWHRRWGDVYLVSMAVSVGAAIPLALHMQSRFFIYLSIFCLYLPFAGFRALARRPSNPHGGARWWDWAAATLALSASLDFLWRAPEMGNLAPIAQIFGLLMAVWTSSDILVLWHPPRHPYFWLVEHMGKMLGSFLAAVTAFLVVQANGMPVLHRYLVPAAVGGPLVIMWIGYHLRRLRRVDQRTHALQVAPSR